MPKATLITMVGLAGLLAMTGCRDRADPPKPVRQTTIISTPGATSQRRPAKPAKPAEPVTPEPVMSSPPSQNKAPSPAAAPMPSPQRPKPAPNQYRDRCGRPLIT
jgi:hypothetical protein